MVIRNVMQDAKRAYNVKTAVGERQGKCIAFDQLIARKPFCVADLAQCFRRLYADEAQVRPMLEEVKISNEAVVAPTMRARCSAAV